MEVKISLAVEKPPTPVRTYEKIPVYAMGQELSMLITFVNTGSGTVSLDDPQTSQALYLKLKQDGPEDALFMLHPSRMDATGEITGPTPSTLDLASDRQVIIPFNLHEVIVDGCFLPGVYDIYVEFKETKSEPFEFGVEYRPESVPVLVELAIDEQADSWLRREAVSWLNKLPEPPAIILPQVDETEAMKQERADANKNSARQFMDHWRYGTDRDEIADFFEQFRLRVKD